MSSLAAARNLKVVIAYDGTNYFGWQIQRGLPTIQAIIQGKLALMTRQQPVCLHGAGRTDTGVHALGMVGSFQTASTIPCPAFVLGLNSLLPPDIRILSVTEAPADFHARRSAKSKTYCYHLTNSAVQMPTERLYCAKVNGTLDVMAIEAGLQYLVGTHDFSSFEATGTRDRSELKGRGAVRSIFSATFKRHATRADRFRFEITGDGFLRHMVRNVVGTMIEVGRGKRRPEDIKELLEACDRKLAGPCAPAHGLFLQEVHY